MRPVRAGAALLGAWLACGCASGPPPPVVAEAQGVEPLSFARTSCGRPVELTRDCSSLLGARRHIVLERESMRVAGSADGRLVLMHVDGVLGAARRGGPGFVTERHNRALRALKAAFEARGLGVAKVTPLVSSGAVLGYLLELEEDGYTWLETDSAIGAQATPPPPAAPAPEDAANTRDEDRTIGFLHFRPGDMPIVVELPRPPNPPRFGSTDDAVQAVAAGFNAWQEAVGARVPWLAFEVVGAHGRPDVSFSWTFDRWSKRHFRRTASADPTEPKPSVRLPVSAPSSLYFTLDWLRRLGLYSAGFALGLNRVDTGESVMNFKWLMDQPDGFALRPTDADVEAFCLLYARPTGLRIDGDPLRSLINSGWQPPTREELVSPCE